MKVRNIEIKYDRTNVDDVQKFEDALEAYQEAQKTIAETTYARQSDKLLAGCEAAAELLRTAFSEDLIEATGVNPRSLMELTDLIVDITDAIMQENKQQVQKVQRLAAKYGNMRA